jgi:hypothetical protein
MEDTFIAGEASWGGHCTLYAKHIQQNQQAACKIQHNCAYSSQKEFASIETVKGGALDLIVPGIYCIPFKYGKINLEQTGCSIKTRRKEHARHISIPFGQVGDD